ncbi:MAG: alkaline phosphatase [Oligoflexia bacterium]|nr:alkaline phosphatase [Oligoflexia bacterium]
MIAGKEKFKHLNLPSSIDSFQLNYGGDQSVANAFEKLFLNEKPNLTLVHLPKVDWTGHRYGWDTTKYIQALKTADKAVGTIVSAIKNSGLSEKTLLIITADHGGTGRGHGGAIPAHRNIPWLAWGVGVKPNNSLPAGISTMDTAATALWALDISVPSEMEGSPVLQAFN